MSADSLQDTEILVVGGRPFAFGMRWTSVASPRLLRTEAQQAAIAEGADYVAIHRSFGQFALASLSNRPAALWRVFHRPRSGVATIAAAAGSATLAAFPLADGRWLVIAIDRKGILPDGDLIVADAREARTRIERLIALSPPSWRRKFLPAEWNIAGSQHADPKTLLGQAAGVRLTPLWFMANRERIRLGLAGAGIAIIGGIVVASRLSFRPPDLPVAVAAPKPVPASWTPAGLTLDACLSALRASQRFNAVPGWIPAKYSCHSGQAVVEFVRAAAGQLSLIHSMLPSAHLSDDGRAAVLAIPLVTQPSISATGGFAPRELYRIVGMDLAQRLNGSFSLQAARKMLPGEADPQPQGQSWTVFTWTYQTQAPAVVWAGALARLGAISVDTLVFSPAENLWQITGSLYAHH